MAPPADTQTGILKRMRKQTAVYWEFLGRGSSVLPSWAAPVEVLVRWQDVKGSGEGLRANLQAEIYPHFEPNHQDYFMLGSLTSGMGNDPRLYQAWEVMANVNTPKLKADQTLYLVQCSPNSKVLAAKMTWLIETVTLRRTSSATINAKGVLVRTTADTTVTEAFKDRLTAGEIDKSRGRFLETDVKWELPKVYVTTEPGKEDQIIDAQGTVWNIIGWTEGQLRSWWRVVCRKAVSS